MTDSDENYNLGVVAMAEDFFARYRDSIMALDLDDLERLVRESAAEVEKTFNAAPTFHQTVAAAGRLEEEPRTRPAGRALGLLMLDRLKAFHAFAPRTDPLMPVVAFLEAVVAGELPRSSVRVPRGSGRLH